jgi:hypothetical protein
MPNGIIRDPIHNVSQKSVGNFVAPSSPSFKDYGILEGDDGHLLLYIKDETSWPLIAGTEVEYDVEPITFHHGGQTLEIDIAIISLEKNSPYVKLINDKIRKNIGKPKEKKDHYKVKLDKSELRGKKIKS